MMVLLSDGTGKWEVVAVETRGGWAYPSTTSERSPASRSYFGFAVSRSERKDNKVVVMTTKVGETIASLGETTSFGLMRNRI